ncbi:hypothetical protein H7347_04795 [Corynebacterium sp. zg-331]|uniref:Rv3235 family protein n=1 Tax=unclassified Corynebacterium TaxID=2624378 RepID=UPI00128E362B|nr:MULTISPECIES: Rv3235 family protein [unclassified Corynebacterium]MBC3185893.1 hypothetical protein [Corynebacterium sp. zg-331]MPV52384.1 hypothetical protein [Corynebacterium sp. zg331]
MLIPIPGYSHLKIYAPEQQPRATPTPPPPFLPDDLGAPPPLRAHVLVLLEVLCGQRPPRQLTPNVYAPGVIARARARRRAPQAVRLRSLHLREHDRGNPEFYGTCEVGGRRYGFAGWLRRGRIAEFRVLR